MIAESDPTIVIVAYRNTSQLILALDSLGQGHPLFVVDNDANTEVRELVEAYGGRYVAPDHNIGFAAGVNIAIGECPGHDLLLLNPDARISAGMPQALAAVLRANGAIGAVAPKLRYANGDWQRVVWPIPSPREAWIDALKLRRAFPPRRVFLIGAVLLLRAEALADVGRFDERFFLYAEECDWQLRALRRGWQLKLVENLDAVHASSGSSEVEAIRNGYFRESAELFGKKWYGSAGWASMQVASLVGNTLRMAANVHRPSQRARYARNLRP